MIWTDSHPKGPVAREPLMEGTHGGQEAKESGHVECGLQSVLQEHDLKAPLPPIRPSS